MRKNLQISLNVTDQYPNSSFAAKGYANGTISLLRCGWQKVMEDLMEEMIAGYRDRVPSASRREIISYIEQSTGILTIYQMHWLREAVKRWRLNDRVLTAMEYKKIYNDRLRQKISHRIALLRSQADKEGFIVKGAKEFLNTLYRKGVALTLTSGTDDIYVQEEARLLGVEKYFQGRIYGALDGTDENTKENLIKRIFRKKMVGNKERVMIG